MKAKKVVRKKPTGEIIGALVQDLPVFPEYEVTGVRQEGKVWFQNRYWEITRLTQPEIQYLKGFPDEFPYIR